MSNKLQEIGEKEIAYITRAIESGLNGKWNKILEREFAKKFNVKFAVGVNSGMSALHCALYAAGVQKGDEVIVPPLTFAAPTFAALYLGAIPIFADIDPKTFLIDSKEIEKKITKRTRAIIPVSLYGLPVNIDAILKIADKHNIIVIEDNAQCFLGKYPDGSIAGSKADLSIFSFQKTKHMTCEAGGMVITNNEKYAERVRKFSILGYQTLKATLDQPMLSKEQTQVPTFLRHESMGFNYRLPELCAAAAVAQLEKLDYMIKVRQQIGEIYMDALSSVEWLSPQFTPYGYEHSYWTIGVKLNTDIVDISWEGFRKKYLNYGGEPYYATWMVNYLEPFIRGKSYSNDQRTITYERGLCPIAEKIQPMLKQFKTNFSSLEYAKDQVEILKKTIATFSMKLVNKKVDKEYQKEL